MTNTFEILSMNLESLPSSSVYACSNGLEATAGAVHTGAKAAATIPPLLFTATNV